MRSDTNLAQHTHNIGKGKLKCIHCLECFVLVNYNNLFQPSATTGHSDCLLASESVHGIEVTKAQTARK